MAESKPTIELLMQRYYNDMYRLACSFLRDPAEADDAAQAAFIAAARGLETFEGRAEVRTWLYRITANTCLSLLRKRR
ncbi:MAG TPA: sigma-70 family RNA polymerase sigma factor, partial [Anaerolineaceae bacterium]|nr:sigma-70 family RNA polymerase sigma factor [Anaerolineaceae bacterium]